MSGIVNPVLKGKRKKPVPKVANPLFVKWLTEWKQEASEKGWMSVHTYSKALKTLKLFPLPLETGKDCRLLQNFGDKICKMLDEKLAEHRRNQASQGICETTTSLDCDDRRTTSSGWQSGRAGTQTVGVLQTCSTKVHNVSDNSDSDAEALSPQKVKKKPRSSGSRSREYVPNHRSGPYALILTLFRYMQDPAFKCYMGKSELSQAAQPLCDKSFVIPDPGSHYTAWSSMGTLIKKGLILKTSQPARYSLTESGVVLGERLDRAEKMDKGTPEAHEDEDQIDRLSKPISQHTEKNVHQNSAERIASVCDISSQDNFIDSDEDGDFERAVAESLLSYSQEVSTHSALSKSLSTSDDIDRSASENIADLPEHERRGEIGKASDPDRLKTSTISQGSRDASEKAVLILSDDDDDDDDEISVLGTSQISPARNPRRLHSLSPSPSPTPQCQAIQVNPQQAFTGPSPVVSESETKSAGTACSQTVITVSEHASNSIPDIAVTEVGHTSILEISDDSDDGSDVSSRKEKYTHISQKPDMSDDCSSDELPDLDLPLSKRLLLKGSVTSGLLTGFSSSSSISSSTSSVLTLPTKENTPRNIDSGSTSCCRVESSTTDQPKNFKAGTSKTSSVPSCSPCSSPPRERYSLQTNNSHDIVMNHGATCSSASYVDNIVDAEIEQWSTQCCQAASAYSLSSATSAMMSERVSQPDPIFTLKPGSFEIVLCLDNREFYGSKSSSKTLLPELMKSGIQCDLRLLHVGDLLWIAREKTTLNSGGAQRKELVLHYIIERKRMDDLVSSMTDGRMKEQKFRLKHCGLSQPIILIEEYGSIQNFSISEDKIKQSIVNSQIIDGFKVKRCNGLKEAVAYLAVMTRFLNQHFLSKTLHAVTIEQHKQLKNQQALEQREHYLMSFESFNEASVKHKDLTVKELFAKQLIQIPGVSADRARAITNVYPTLSALLEAYRRCTSEKDKEKLLAVIKCGKKERNLGIAISRMLYLLYTQKGSLS